MPRAQRRKHRIPRKRNWDRQKGGLDYSLPAGDREEEEEYFPIPSMYGRINKASSKEK